MRENSTAFNASQVAVQMNKKYDRNVSFNHTQDFTESIMQE